eukprot:1161922-Pelagomonas_calceolata.AAC.9
MYSVVALPGWKWLLVISATAKKRQQRCQQAICKDMLEKARTRSKEQGCCNKQWYAEKSKEMLHRSVAEDGGMWRSMLLPLLKLTLLMTN